MNRLIGCSAVALILGLWLALPAGAADTPEHAKRFLDYTPSQDYVTPHTPWYRPYERGPVRALFIRSFGATRGVVEIAQRLSLEYTVPPLLMEDSVFPWIDKASAAGMADYVGRLDRFLAATNRYDVIVLGPFGGGDWYEDNDTKGKLPKAFWAALRRTTEANVVERIKAGTGFLVLSKPPALSYPGSVTFSDLLDQVATSARWAAKPSTSADDLLQELDTVSAVPLPAINVAVPNWKSASILRGQYGKGRVIAAYTPLDYPALLECLLWCAGKEPPVLIESLKPSSPAMKQESMAGQRISLSLQALADCGSTTVELQVRPAEDGPIEFAKTQALSLPKGPAGLSWELPVLAAGNHLAAVRICRDGKAIKSGSCAFRVEPMAMVAVRPAKEIPQPGEAVNGSITVVNAGQQPHPVDCLASLVDPFGRVLATNAWQVAAAAGATNELAFSWKVSMPLGVLHTITAQVALGNVVLNSCSASVSLLAEKSGLDDWISFSWMSTRRQGEWDGLQRMGFNAAQGAFDGGRDVAGRGLTWYALGVGMDRKGTPAYCDWQNGARLQRKWERTSTSVTEPDVVADLHACQTERAQAGHRYGALGYNMADEPSLTHWESNGELDWTPSCITLFRERLKKTYGSLEALNAAWDMDFKRWEPTAEDVRKAAETTNQVDALLGEVRTRSWEYVDPMIEAEVKDRPNIAPWLDFREHMHRVWADFFKDSRNTFEAADPGKHFGFCGVEAGHPYSGMDVWRMAPFSDFVQPYTPCVVWRSFNPRGYYRRWTGYQRGYLTQWDEQWDAFFDGQRGLGFFCVEFAVLPDCSLNPNFAPVLTEINRTFGNGIQRLFMETDRQAGDVLIHYSQPSIDAGYMMKYWHKAIRDGIGFSRQAGDDLTRALLDLGQDPLYLAYEQLEQGRLLVRKPRVFVLPVSCAISEKEADAIRAYVEQGGILVADVCAALRNEHGRPYPAGRLDSLFGIRRAADGSNTVSMAQGTMEGIDGTFTLWVEHGIEPLQGKALAQLRSGGTNFPLAVINTVGRGKTVYLGFVGDYAKVRKTKANVLGLYRAILQAAGGPAPILDVADAPGRQAAGRVLVHRGVRSQFVGYYRDVGYQMADSFLVTGDDVKAGAPDVRMGLASPLHVYDLLEQKDLGETNSVAFRAEPGKGRLFALYPYRIQKLTLGLAPGYRRGGTLQYQMELTVSDGEPGTHIVHLQVTDPDRKEAGFYTCNIPLVKGAHVGLLPLALNMKPGSWTIRATEVASGITADQSFVLPE